MKTAVIGAGSWGTAVAWLLGGKGIDVTMWAREPEIAEGINSEHRNPFFLKDVTFDPRVRATSDIEQAISGAEAVSSSPRFSSPRRYFRVSRAAALSRGLLPAPHLGE